MTARAGFSMVEVLVAVALTALAAAGLAAVAPAATTGLTAARTRAAALALATARIEALRAGPRTAGTDTVLGSDGTRFTRRWAVVPGRGRPDGLSVEVTWRGGHRVAVTTEALP
jgi:prepilin-type N-terminal cleavage/methylation domain-containing protein